ncbi:n-acetyltransferase B complex (NatB) non catalytic subunit [Hirsutella rhossiliensis]|uniref:N-acetyltransferase B complex (NatB) non catalytic subunit domain-containing protein n=1 Tax=Hirsutella rhossiliensis TaxID=111463 RepID=A0A9P8MWR6_9HYPO|nr:n-acetyltransferase B complex (NatB) non catalytic subunit domain-containing protein [Hirsutella rhossiliensis]KAH0962680.1 n-acetyltransferase B complex (NatB) non catalytic subunit domain-containing protein [Hirsutella rhossiliensis]
MSRPRPRLRNGVDLQLQSAFQDGHWPVVIRLAEKRARTFQDQYFEIVKICAESQLDDPVAKFAAVAAVRQFVRAGTVVKDVDAIDLLEWATLDLMDEADFAESLGALRVRAAKASPKDRNAVTRCLESCLLHWDLVSAQQIAAILDRSIPSERSFLFWNIVITHMLATSSQSPPEKQKLYGTLALKQIERAAQLTEEARKTAATDEPPTLPARGIQTEQEILLLYDIVDTHGTAADFDKLLASPVFSPVSQFRLGRKEPFLQALASYQRNGNWETVLDLCHDCLSDADEDDEPTLLASDWLVWRHFIDAATHLKSVRPDATKAVQRVLLALVKSKNLRPIYRRNLLLARLSAAFNLGPGDEEDLLNGEPSSLRLRELISFIDDQRASSACFDDIRSFVEKLDVSAAQFLAYHHVPQFADAGADAGADAEATARIRLLSLKLQYLLTTCPSSAVRVSGQKPTSKCAICDASFDVAMCPPCLSGIGRSALSLYAQTSKELADDPVADNEILPEISLAVAFCNLKLAFNADRPGFIPSASSSTQHLLRALFILESQLRLTPKHGPISLMLVQLHLALGSAHKARQVWNDLAVKRTIVDSLAPMFYDRLSTIAPAVLSPSDSWGWRLTETLESHYATSLKLCMPRRLVDAFEAGSYRSIMDIPKYIENLRASCTRMMSLVEESRAERLLGMSPRRPRNDARFAEVPDELFLSEVIDYGSFPSWDCSSCPPVHACLRIGPPPSNERSHLSLLAEAFHDALNYKPPSTYKASAAAGTDQVFVLEMMARLGHSFSKFLGGGGAKCTPEEMLYYDALSLLCMLMSLVTGMARKGALPDVFGCVTESLRTALESLAAGVARKGDQGIEQVTRTLKSLHGIAMLRETAWAVRLASRWILDYNEREKERDRSGGSSLPKEVVAQVKGLQSAAETALGAGRELVRGVAGDGALTGRDAVAQLRRWVFGGEEALGDVVGDGAVAELVESWSKGVAGWKLVKWE